jgi:hypothetical protein
MRHDGRWKERIVADADGEYCDAMESQRRCAYVQCGLLWPHAECEQMECKSMCGSPRNEFHQISAVAFFVQDLRSNI